ncbi:amino acid ABC transporter substrate-binding protein (PAAT family) [Paraburkholderia sp. BL27I4N3]|uniref:substrate-binding periplasmic protein n=1 Tax=Paraburkholderia sp. BL27I4N3 TaxID=1938805 RepID=UPI000E280E42|nr:ABC transporter substrate-binding protein [Paraburkholderia sp. BL27I4N3]REE21715.1 amino acid ABC transporter substrate-binding protein (PAAT family) [Paraburkholderia sp. BL27I4N3]
MNKFSNMVIATVVSLGAIGCSVPSWAQQPLKVAGQDVQPWVFHDKNSDSLSGVFVDLTNAIAKDAGLPVQYQLMIFGDLIPALASGKIDVIATNMAITPARAQQVDFSDPVYNAPTEVVVVPANDTTAYQDLADLKNFPVGAQKGSIQLALLQRIGGFSEIRIYDTLEDAWSAVVSGQIKAAVTSGPDTIYASKHGRLTNLRIVSSYQSQSPKPRIGIAVRKGNSELLERINRSLAKLEADGTVKAIFVKNGVDDWAPPK